MEALHSEYAVKGVSIVAALQTTDYGSGEFLIEDNDGYLLRFGQ